MLDAHTQTNGYMLDGCSIRALHGLRWIGWMVSYRLLGIGPAAGQLSLQLTFQIGGDLVGVLVERHHHGCVALGVERLQIGASCHQHDADVAAILFGGNVQSCLTAKRQNESLVYYY